MTQATQALVQEEVKKEETKEVINHCPYCKMELPFIVVHSPPSKKSFWKRHINPNIVTLIMTLFTFAWTSICFILIIKYFKSLSYLIVP